MLSILMLLAGQAAVAAVVPEAPKATEPPCHSDASELVSNASKPMPNHEHFQIVQASAGESVTDCCQDVDDCSYSYCVQVGVLPTGFSFQTRSYSAFLAEAYAAPIARSASLYHPPQI